MTTFTTKAADAASMVAQWFAMVPDVAQQSTPKDTAWWVKQIQQDGSHTAFLNFADGIAKQHGPQAATELTNAVKAQTQQTGLPPWTPATGATNGQLPGTNTKSGSAIIGSALTSPVGKIIEDTVAGVLDVATGGVATPFTTAGLAVLQGGGAALQPGANIGDIAKGAIGGAGTGAAVGAGAGLLNSATGGSLVSSGLSGSPSLPSASPVGGGGGPSPSSAGGIQWDANGNPVMPGTSTQDLGNATAAASGSSGAIPSVGGASGSPSLPSASPVSSLLSQIPGIGPLLAGNGGLNALAIAQGVNAAQLGAKSTDFADQAANTAKDRWTAQAPLRTAGTAGMLNPVTPDLSNLSAIAGRGNPFAMPAASAVAPTSGLPLPSPVSAPVSPISAQPMRQLPPAAAV